MDGRKMKTRKPIEKRIEIIPWSGCWIWMGWLDENGYGNLKNPNNGKRLRAHRWSYELHHGQIPTGKIICHTCDIPSCVNPNHLYAGTVLENNLDRKRRNRGGQLKISGELSKVRKLTKADVLEIRNSDGTLASISKKFGIGISQVHRIKTNQQWRTV
jgi:hypothetical protein